MTTKRISSNVPRSRAATGGLSGLVSALVIAAAALLHSPAVQAGPLLDRIENGKSIRVGFSTARPWCYQHEDGSAGGFALTIPTAVLKKMGYENIELVEVADWGSLIPGLMANQFDILSCGLYITEKRCGNVAFSDPYAVAADVFLVPEGNPKGVENWDDVIAKGAIVGTVNGSNNYDQAIAAGVDASQLLGVPGPTELNAALISGRVDAGAANIFDAEEYARRYADQLDATPVAPMAKYATNYATNVFRPNDADFVAQYNAAQAGFLGTEEMLALTSPDFYSPGALPPANVTAEGVCAGF